MAFDRPIARCALMVEPGIPGHCLRPRCAMSSFRRRVIVRARSAGRGGGVLLLVNYVLCSFSVHLIGLVGAFFCIPSF